MPTYDQLNQEAAWRNQIVAPNMDQVLIRPLRTFYGLGPASIGAPGDNNHLRGRHRSRDWCLTSAWCTDRGYGTRDARDRRGDGRWYRAFDTGITGQKLYAASGRMRDLVRSGRDSGRVAEWFGTLDGRTVTGWYEGAPGSSDTSHLSHLHVGVWTEFADDADLMQLLYATITGEDQDVTPPQAEELHRLHELTKWNVHPWTAATLQGVGRLEAAAAEDRTRDAATLVAIQALAAQIQAGGGSVDVAAITAAIAAEAVKTRTMVEQLQATLAAKEDELRQVLAAAAQAEADRLKA